MALFGKTAKQWRDENPDKEGNIRDNVYKTIGFLIEIREKRLNKIFCQKMYES